MSVKARLKEFIKSQDLRTTAFEKSIGVKNAYVNSIVKSIGAEKALTINRVYPSLNMGWLLTGEGEMLKKEKQVQLSQVPFDNYEEIPFLSIEVQAGYPSGYSQDLESFTFDDLDTILAPKQFEKGKYVNVEVKGDSMTDGSDRSLKEGTILLTKEEEERPLKRLQFRQFLYVVMGKDGVVLKQVTDHDVDKGILKVKSWNPNYEPYEINVKSIFKIFRVLKIIDKKITF